MSRRATSQDVADLAGVSRSAVSLVLNGHGAGNIAPEKQRVIRDAARRLNYTPNAVALSLRNARTMTVGLLFWGGPERAAWVSIYGALEAATELHYLLAIMDTRGDRDVEDRAISALLDRQVDGFLVVAPEPGPYEVPERLRGLPLALVNCHDAADASEAADAPNASDAPAGTVTGRTAPDCTAAGSPDLAAAQEAGRAAARQVIAGLSPPRASRPMESDAY